MSDYDRRTWQRPKGERSADPDWEDQVEEATARPAKVRGVTLGRGRKKDIAGNHGRRGLRALLKNRHPLAGPDEPEGDDDPCSATS